MSLQERLDKLKKEFEANIPPEALSIMHRATDDLLNSGAIERTLKAGDRLPAFTLPNEQGQMVASSDLLLKGPLVLSFYRGVW